MLHNIFWWDLLLTSQFCFQDFKLHPFPLFQIKTKDQRIQLLRILGLNSKKMLKKRLRMLWRSFPNFHGFHQLIKKLQRNLEKSTPWRLMKVFFLLIAKISTFECQQQCSYSWYIYKWIYCTSMLFPLFYFNSIFITHSTIWTHWMCAYSLKINSNIYFV